MQAEQSEIRPHQARLHGTELAILTSWDSLLSWMRLSLTNVAARRATTDYDPIFDVVMRAPTTRRARLPRVRSRSDGTLQDHLAAVSFDGDPIGIHLGVALERFLDLALMSVVGPWA